MLEDRNLLVQIGFAALGLAFAGSVWASRDRLRAGTVRSITGLLLVALGTYGLAAVLGALPGAADGESLAGGLGPGIGSPLARSLGAVGLLVPLAVVALGVARFLDLSLTSAALPVAFALASLAGLVVGTALATDGSLPVLYGSLAASAALGLRGLVGSLGAWIAVLAWISVNLLLAFPADPGVVVRRAAAIGWRVLVGLGVAAAALGRAVSTGIELLGRTLRAGAVAGADAARSLALDLAERFEARRGPRRGGSARRRRLRRRAIAEREGGLSGDGGGASDAEAELPVPVAESVDPPPPVAERSVPGIPEDDLPLPQGPRQLELDKMAEDPGPPVGPRRTKVGSTDIADYKIPPVSLLEEPAPSEVHRPSRDELITHAEALEQKLADFGIQGQVREVSPGPVITRFEVVPAPGVKINPTRSFLRRATVPFCDAGVGMVQARWGHLNRDYSLLTRVAAFLLDGHLIVEQSARHLSGRFFNFNGTAGIWRREAIESAGGWSHDTLTEDLDLSYRAQLAGWRFVFLPDLVVPAELPVEMNAYRTQQHRWAKGSVQTAIKILPRMIRSDQPLFRKVEALFHLCSNSSYLFMLVPSLLVLPILPFRGEMLGGAALPLYALSFVLATLSVVAFYGVTAREAGQPIRLRWVLAIMSLGIGLSLNNGRAVIEALFGHRGKFRRTPKYRVESRRDGWKGKAYSGSRDLFGLGEVALGVYFSVAIAYALWAGYWGSIPFLVLFQAGFLYVGLTSLRFEIPLPRAVQPSQSAVARAGR